MTVRLDRLPPLTVEVDCSGVRHRITWRRGELVLHDHDLEAEQVAERLGGEAPFCVSVLEALGSTEVDLVALLGEPGESNPRREGMQTYLARIARFHSGITDNSTSRIKANSFLWDLPTVLRHRIVLEAAMSAGIDEEARALLAELADRTRQLDADSFRTLARSISAMGRDVRGTVDLEDKVLARFFDGPRLREIPSQLSKRRVVLQRLVREFEAGREYTEKEVSRLLSAFHPDFAALRRYMVDEGLLERDQGIYRRVDGTAEA